MKGASTHVPSSRLICRPPESHGVLAHRKRADVCRIVRRVVKDAEERRRLGELRAKVVALEAERGGDGLEEQLGELFALLHVPEDEGSHVLIRELILTMQRERGQRRVRREFRRKVDAFLLVDDARRQLFADGKVPSPGRAGPAHLDLALLGERLREEALRLGVERHLQVFADAVVADVEEPNISASGANLRDAAARGVSWVALLQAADRLVHASTDETARAMLAQCATSDRLPLYSRTDAAARAPKFGCGLRAVEACFRGSRARTDARERQCDQG